MKVFVIREIDFVRCPGNRFEAGEANRIDCGVSIYAAHKTCTDHRLLQFKSDSRFCRKICRSESAADTGQALCPSRNTRTLSVRVRYPGSTESRSPERGTPFRARSLAKSHRSRCDENRGDPSFISHCSSETAPQVGQDKFSEVSLLSIQSFIALFAPI